MCIKYVAIEDLNLNEKNVAQKPLKILFYKLPKNKIKLVGAM